MQVFSFISFCAILCGALSWEYSDKDYWWKDYPQCNGSRQSPIDINTNIETTPGNPIKFVNYDMNIPGKSLPMKNDKGHTVKIYFSNLKETQIPKIKGGVLKSDEFVLQEMHFHWGANRFIGSEHTLNGKSYALEVHLVHKNIKYASVPEAASHSDGLAVLGILYQEQRINPRSQLYPITSHFSEVRTCNQSSTLSGNINLRRMFPAFASRTYYNYPGSLTTPACNEAVTWIVYANPSGVTTSEMKEFRSLRDCKGKPLVNNFRDPQPLNGRVPEKVIEKWM